MSTSARDVAIVAENLGKHYYLGERLPYHALRDVVAGSLSRGLGALGGRSPRAEAAWDVWALRGVSFSIKRGDIVGIIGRNGAGKSTLLKILSRITEPTEGSAEIRGRVGSLLEVGTGFHPELTGRENVYFNGSLLGMSRSEIEDNFHAIVSFADVERFVDTPVKHYSSGMQMRLAFSVAAHLSPEIVLVDEVLGVGDTAFQNKCLGKIEDVANSGRTVVVVSHNLGTISNLCDKAIYLESGRIKDFGHTRYILTRYVRDTSSISGGVNLEDGSVRRRGDGSVVFKSIRILDDHGGQMQLARECEPFSIEMVLGVAREVDVRIISVTVVDTLGRDVLTTMHYDALPREPLGRGRHEFTVRFDPNPLARGDYRLRLACLGPNFYEYDHIHEACLLEVAPPLVDPDVLVPRPGSIRLNLPWRRRALAGA